MVLEKGFKDPKELRRAVREGNWRFPTPSQCPGFVQANLVILPTKYAFDFLGFCHRNPRPCPLLEVLEPGVYEPVFTAPGADIRTDCPRYRVFEGGKSYEVDNIEGLWKKDLVSFLLGCSFTFDSVLLAARVPVRHIEDNRNVPMYITDIPCNGFGIFKGPLVVSMRPIPGSLVSLAVELSGKYPLAHGSPVHIGDPREIGIGDLGSPQFGDPVRIGKGELPVFWACGVTPQVAIIEAGVDFAITHAPGHMFVTDLDIGSVEGQGIYIRP